MRAYLRKLPSSQPSNADPMRHLALILPLIAAACTQAGAPLPGWLAPGVGLGQIGQPGHLQDRAAVEVHVKANLPAILAEIAAGNGPALGRAYDLAGVPATDRAARTIQLQGDLPLWTASPGALVGALLAYGR